LGSAKRKLREENMRELIDRERDSFIEMWRFVVPGQIIAKYLPSFIEYPPMQEGGSFSIQDLKEKVEAAQRAAQAGSQ
jgi:hypothetical protein